MEGLKDALRRNKVKLLVLDSDGVTVPRGTKIFDKEEGDKYVVHFETDRISRRLADKINLLKRKMYICVSSGRSLVYLHSMYDKIVGGKLILTAENGNLSLWDGCIVQHFFYDKRYFEKLAKIRNEIKHLPFIKGFEPKQFILTVHAEKEVKEVYRIVRRFDRKKELKIMWNGEAFDIQKKDVSKGIALEKIAVELRIEKKEIVAIGDRVNDKELIGVAGVGISADSSQLKADYYLEPEKEKLPAEKLVDLLLEIYG